MALLLRNNHLFYPFLAMFYLDVFLSLLVLLFLLIFIDTLFSRNNYIFVIRRTILGMLLLKVWTSFLPFFCCNVKTSIALSLPV